MEVISNGDLDLVTGGRMKAQGNDANIEAFEQKMGGAGGVPNGIFRFFVTTSPFMSTKDRRLMMFYSDRSMRVGSWGQL